MSALLEPAAQPVDVIPLSAHIGAEIRGVDLTQPLTTPQISAIRAALLKWRVIFFREQFLTHEQHVAFSAQFGEPTVGHPVFGHVDGHPAVYSIAKHRKATRFEGEPVRRPWTGWHTDVTAAVNPPWASILRGVTIPPYGGDTHWTNLVRAYETLSAPLRFVDGLRGIHRFTPPAGARATGAFDDAVERRPLVTEHPLVRVHPETGERALYVAELPEIDRRADAARSQALLELLWEHVTRPEFTIRFKWEPRSIAFWDNRATAHLAPVDIFDLDFDRQLYRTTLIGDVPVGPTAGRRLRSKARRSKPRRRSRSTEPNRSAGSRRALHRAGLSLHRTVRTKTLVRAARPSIQPHPVEAMPAERRERQPMHALGHRQRHDRRRDRRERHLVLNTTCACSYSAVRFATSPLERAASTSFSKSRLHHFARLLPCTASQPSSVPSQLSGSPLSPDQPYRIASCCPSCFARRLYSPHS